ncbi:hypothetical protein FEM48_Zijuj04G0190400 [Ziziphus jujuba var. spinosa]|uniref:Dihydroorotase n=1 Tax=Ziziphus jujuba var. spinosa TaxID=714518 RepID=A0A978VLM2_ZIZJJ|nr:hypothetical protein FEM48_Zijuj04G0190400 [Ziziphus jujuba var. spinosa]
MVINAIYKAVPALMLATITRAIKGIAATTVVAGKKAVKRYVYMTIANLLISSLDIHSSFLLWPKPKQLRYKGTKMELTITQPNDWHIHLRDGDLLEAVVPHIASYFGRGIVMPNLKPPITTTAATVVYRESILKALPSGSDFTPLMTLYLTYTTTPNEIKLARKSGVVFAMKLYLVGIFNAPVALSLYAKGFDEAGVLDKIKAFTSFNGLDFYGLPRNTSKIKLKMTPWKVLETFFYSFGDIVPMFAEKHSSSNLPPAD